MIAAASPQEAIVLKPRGIHCPEPTCFSTHCSPVGWKRPLAGLRVRYFVCLKCKGRFSTKERLVGPLKPRKPHKNTDVKTAD